ncbi:MAG: ABC transporter permease [Anaerolineae bacterium]|nr:ABC transporter permease [Anaerolineae bacterium]
MLAHWMMVARWIRYHGRILAAMLVSICLLVAFSASVPMMVGQVLREQAARLIQSVRPENLNITVTNPTPVRTDVIGLLNQAFGGITTSVRQYDRALGPAALPPNGMLCGYGYQAGETITVITPFLASPADHCYMMYGFSGLDQLFTVREGRWPESLPSPVDNPVTVPTVMGAAQVEAVLTPAAAEGAGIHIGDMLVVGNRFDRTVTVEIVGLVEPLLDSADPFWSGKQLVLTGSFRPYGSLESRFDLGLIVTEQAFQEWIQPIAETTDYAWWLEVNPNQLDAAWLTRISGQLFQLESQLRLENPAVEILTGMKPVITAFTDAVARIDPPARWLIILELAFALPLLGILAGLLLENQRSEWTIITRRGSGRWQVAALYVLTLCVLGLIAGSAGPLIAAGLLAGLQHTVRLSEDVILTGWMTAGLGVVALSLPVWSLLRESLLVTEGRPQPPRQNVKRLFYPALLLLLVGGVLVIRLYLLGVNGRDDPFSVVGLVLLVGGLILLWLRMFPLLIGFVGRILRRLDSHPFGVALWQIARDPAAYATWMTLVIGAMALGMTAITFGTTQDTNARTTAHQQVGADVSITLDSFAAPSGTDWRALPGVMDAAELFVLDGNWRAAGVSLKVMGVDSASIAGLHADQGALLAELDAAAPSLGGLALPVGTQAVTVQVYPVAGADYAVNPALELLLVNTIGENVSVPLSPPDSPSDGTFETLAATLPDSADGGIWRMTGLRFLSTSDRVDFTHTVYLDNLAAVDHQGNVTALEGFERDTGSIWMAGANQNPDALIMRPNRQVAAEGTASLEVDYRIRNVRFTEIHPVLAVYPAPNVPVPVLVSEAAAEAIRRRSSSDEIVGINGTLDLEVSLGSLPLSYQVIGIIPAFPGTLADEAFFVTPVDVLLNRINADRKAPRLYHLNRIWLALDDGQDDAALRNVLAANPVVRAVTYASDIHDELRLAPPANIVTLILYSGFGVTLVMCLLGSGAYFSAVFRRRRMATGVLGALGWSERQVWRWVTGEQIILILAGQVMGIVLGGGLFALLVPFLTPIRGTLLALAPAGIAGLLVGGLVALLIVLMIVVTRFRRVSLPERLRPEEE